MREYISSVTSKGQVTIPIAVRKQLGVATRDRVAFVVDDNGQVALRPANLTISSFRSFVPAIPGKESIDFEDQIEEAMEEQAERIVSAMEKS
jgi:AbrB family looped-hinge helix DNA binding protein